MIEYFVQPLCRSQRSINTRLMITFEDAECNQLALSLHFSDGDHASLYIPSFEDGILDLAKFDPETVQFDLIVFPSKASAVYDQRNDIV